MAKSRTPKKAIPKKKTNSPKGGPKPTVKKTTQTKKTARKETKPKRKASSPTKTTTKPKGKPEVKPIENRLAVSTTEAAIMLGLTERTIFNLTKEGKIKCKKVGWRSLYPVASLKAFLESPNEPIDNGHENADNDN